MKFGGSVLGTYRDLSTSLESLYNIILPYLLIKKDKREPKVIIVLSAFKEITRKLSNINSSLNFNPKSSDEILSYGEILTCSVVQKYLEQMNISVKSFHSHFLKCTDLNLILTDSKHSFANILHIDNRSIESADSDVVLIPGFIGKDEKNTITTLGFEGSDITAITVAISIKSTQCIFFKDVGGAYTTNPSSIKSARLFEILTYKEAIAMSKIGCRLLHTKCIKIAQKHNISILIKDILETKTTTINANKNNSFKFFCIQSNIFDKSFNSVEDHKINISIHKIHKKYLLSMVEKYGLKMQNAFEEDEFFFLMSSVSKVNVQETTDIIREINDELISMIFNNTIGIDFTYSS
ncbi:Aspartokinase domain-containing protein [Candidatus Gromoviella agglomerans]|nr:Aspartokinase domain-containing protein [Candidatus Gromoviella agglomerans]